MPHPRVGRALLALAVAGIVGQAWFLRAVLRERFSFANLAEAASIATFDEATSPGTGLDLRLPTVDGRFASLVRTAIHTRDATPSDTAGQIVQWVHQQLRSPAGDDAPAAASNSPLSRWVPFEVIERARAGTTFWCDSYARLAAAAGQVLGLKARVIWLDGHVVVEFFDPDLHRWLGADPTMSAFVTDPDSGSILSFAEAAARVRDGRSIAVRAVGSLRPDVDLDGSVAYLEKVLRRELLIYVDGQTTVQKITPDLLTDWLLGRTHGVRLATSAAEHRSRQRRGLLATSALVLVALAGWLAIRLASRGTVRRRPAPLVDRPAHATE